MGFPNIEEKLTRSLQKLGYKVGENPKTFIVFGVMTALLCGSGFMTMNYERDLDKLLIPSTADCRNEKMRMDEYFRMDYSHFEPDRMTDNGKYLSILIYAADDGNIFRQLIFNDIEAIDRMVKNVTVNLHEADWDYTNLCAKKKGDCVNNNKILSLSDVMDDIENGDVVLTYPFAYHPDTFETIILAGSIAEPEIRSGEDDDIVNCKAIRLSYFIDSGSDMRKER
jgi:hypothetical protein